MMPSLPYSALCTNKHPQSPTPVDLMTALQDRQQLYAAEALAELHLAQHVFEARVRFKVQMLGGFPPLPQCIAPIPPMFPRTETSRLEMFSSLFLPSDSSSLGSQRHQLLTDNRESKYERSSLGTSPPQTQPCSRRMHISEIRPTDILCGRGGMSNRHVGNFRYQKLIQDMKETYKQADANMKTVLSRAIVEHVCRSCGRFIKNDDKGGYFVLTRGEARVKTSQALRDNKMLKWTK